MLLYICVFIGTACVTVHNKGFKHFTSRVKTFFLFFFPFIFFTPSFSLSLLVVIQIRGQVAGSSPLLPTTVRALHFYRDKISALSFLVDSR